MHGVTAHLDALDEQLADLSCDDGLDERGRFESTLCLALRAVADQRHASLALVLAGSSVECRAPTLVDCTDAGTSSAQQMDDLRLAAARGVVQRGA